MSHIEELLVEQEDLDDPHKAVEKSQWFLDERSKAAEGYIRNYLIILDPEGSFHDSEVNQFLIHRELNPIPTTNQQSRKTPDLMCLYKNILIVGDVAVSRSPEETSVRKEIKYRMLIDAIKLANPQLFIRFEAFVFKDDGSNVETVQDRLRNLITEYTPTMGWKFGSLEIKLRQDIITWNNRLNFIARGVKDKITYIHLYQQLMMEEDDEVLLGSMTQQEQYIPKVTERDIAKSIFDKMRSSGPSMKTTKDIDVMKLMDDIEKKRDEDYEEAEIKHCIPYLFNSGDDSELMDLELLDDYRYDLAIHGKNLSTLFPHGDQLSKMKQIKDEFNEQRINKENKDRRTFMKTLKEKYGQATPYYCPKSGLTDRASEEDNIKEWYFSKVNQINDAKKPGSIKSSEYNTCDKQISSLINVMNMKGKSRSTNIEFDMPDRGDKIRRESQLHEVVKPRFDDINKKVGTCLLSCVRKFVNDVAHMPLNLKNGIYYSIPIQKNMILLVFTQTNLTKRNPSVYFMTITRFDKSCSNDLMLFGAQAKLSKYCEETTKYHYIASKLHKYELEKLSKLCNIDAEFRVHYMSMMSMSDLDEEIEKRYKSSYVGLTCLCLLDLHQKPSEMLDLMKYLVAMPMSSHSSLDLLLSDKLSLMMKTNLDVYLHRNIFRFLEKNIKLNKTRSLNPLRIQKNGYVLPESFNITGQFAMFCDTEVITENLLFYISESQLIFHARPKKLYNSQFIDKCAYKVADYNDKMKKDEEANPGWTTKGFNEMDNGLFNYPFESDFCYSRDAMYYAQLDEDSELARFIPSMLRTNNKKVADLFPNNLSMRGACIIPGSTLDNTREIKKKIKNHDEVIKMLESVNKTKREKPLEELFKVRRSTTAMLSGLVMMERYINEDDTEKCRVGQIMSDHKDDEMYFNMSEKEQRGGGRPIGSADFFTKQRLYCIEMIYQRIGQAQGENLMAKKVNRSAKLSDVSRNRINQAIRNDKKVLSYIVMDQSQFSESDNMNKFTANIVDNRCIPENLKGDMIDSLNKMKTRTQFFPKIPDQVIKEYPEYLTKDGGIRGVAGWVQGMLNISSTHIHIIAVKWLTKIFNKYYKEFSNKEYDQVEVDHLVNSDDSFAVICSKYSHMVTDFYDFFLLGKRMFCLKQNKKKSYMSSLIGEVIQKYVANGSTINIWAKDAVSIFNSMRGLDMYKDISTAIGSLQTLSRNGAPEDACCYVRAECKTKILNMFNVNKGKINDISSLGIDIGKLPIELMGWPKYITTFELCVSGSFAQANYCVGNFKRSANEKGDWTTKEAMVTIAAVMVNMSNKINDNSDIEIYDKEVDQDSNEMVVRNIRRIRDLLEAEDYTDDLNLTVEEIQADEKHREKNLIAYKSLGMSIIGGNFTKSLVNPFCFCHPFSSKVTETVKFLRNISGEGSGLAGLLKVRTSIRQSVVDIKENVSTLLMQLSESGFNNDVRMIASASSIVASSRSVTISGSNKRHTIRQCYKILLDISYKMSGREFSRKSASQIPSILRDPTFRADMADEILPNMQDSGTEAKKPTVVTLMPEMESSLGIANPLQLVLAEIVKPGIIVKEGYILNYPDQLSLDINIVKSKFGDWLSVTSNKLQVACGIYYHYLNARRGRYVVGPPLDKSDMMSFLISWYKEKFSQDFSIVSQFVGDTVRRSEHFSDYAPHALMSAVEMYMKLCVISKTIEKELFINNLFLNLRGAKYSLKQLAHSELVDILQDEVDVSSKQLLGAMLLDITGDDKWIRRFVRAETTRADWVKEQDKRYNPISKRVTWAGEFIVDIKKGDDVVRIEGEPGNMKIIKSTTANTRKISDMMLFLRKNNRFDNYEIKKDIKTLYNDKFYSTMNEVNILTVDEVLDPSSKYLTVRSNPIKEGKDISYFTEKGLIPFKLVQPSELTSAKSDMEEYIRFELDVGKYNFLVGVNTSSVLDRDKASGVERYVSRETKTRICKLDQHYNKFTVTGMESKILMLAGISMQIFIEDNELKNIIRNQVNMISSTRLEKYVKWLVPKSEIMDSVFRILCSHHCGFAKHENELYSDLKMIDVDITATELNYEQDIDKLTEEQEELGMLEASYVTESEGNMVSKMINAYSSRNIEPQKIVELCELLASTQMSNILQTLRDKVGQGEGSDWADEVDREQKERELLTNTAAIFQMLFITEMEEMEAFIEEEEEEADPLNIDFKEKTLSTFDDEMFSKGKTKEQCKSILANVNEALECMLLNRLFQYDTFLPLLKKTGSTDFNMKNKNVLLGRLIASCSRRAISQMQSI
ncbi:RNA-dependent RNA polymerase [Ferak virus]|uniref:RNA-directed RNA polymerase L n=5 Tax=Ferak virus TaxID=1664810 RepID=A0A0H4B3S5_9VIRU|nr:RNA-dependent RNA polymerase [Ferak virus]AKN56888.1 RNA-dependent RNA polymerase [Ferak virus]